jgi:DNA-binding transcriptional ArsR family regulator
MKYSDAPLGVLTSMVLLWRSWPYVSFLVDLFVLLTEYRLLVYLTSMLTKKTPLSLARLDEIFSALSNAKRREMVLNLSFRPSTVGQLADEYGLSLPAIHRHIRVLEDAQLLQRKKVGRTNFVAIKRTALRQAQEWLGQFHLEWGSDQETLENVIDQINQK